MTMSRRQILATLLAAGAAGQAPGKARADGATGDAVAAAGAAEGVPPVLRAGDSTHAPDADRPPVRLWTYNDAFPGPLLRLTRGSRLDLRLDNALTQPTSLHWHGVRLANAMDGVAGLTQEAVAPGASSDIAFTARDAGTFIYRPMVPEHAAEQTERGLAGVLVVDEAVPPHADDFVLILDDIALDEAGQVRMPFAAAADIGLAGRLGNRLLVNGRATAQTLHRPPGHRLRVRIAHVANARPLTLLFENIATAIIAADGHPVDDPFAPSRDRLTLVPGNRVDVVLTAPQAGATGAIKADLGGGLPLLQLTGEGHPVADRPAAVAPLPANDLPDSLDLARARRFDIAVTGGLDPKAAEAAIADPSRVWRLGGAAWADAAQRPLFRVPVGTPVVLALANATPFLQVLHLHGHHARQLHRLDDGWEPYWLDTIAVPAGQTVRVAFLADNPGRWMLGSAIVDRLGAGLAGWFEVG